MALITGQQISNFYKQFGDVEVAFNKEVIRATGLQTRNNLVKCKGAYWPCFVYSSSMKQAKIVASIKEDFHTKLQEANNLVSLQLTFAQLEKSNPIILHISAKLTGIAKYGEESSGLSLLTLTYTQRPSDDLIVTLGRLLESNLNSQKRKEERILINDQMLRKMGLKSKNIIVVIDNIPRKALLRDLSFSGAKLIIAGLAKFLVDKAIMIKLEVEETSEVFNLMGKVLRFEPIENRKDIASIAVLFDEKHVPIEYKLFFNDFLTRQKPPKEQ
ncbi:MAG: PilZ domain-containing protein [Spirochaetales bacterium]|uniref:PilZ domain-containing protein n=1 Tax=Candidatus Thalassospirochaeta sargassi TaxID=3119039 RepID=A0AAJ1IGE6_9SPIO|nr:PilZ domain-containing protein [Spirochaetales bacterium]